MGKLSKAIIDEQVNKIVYMFEMQDKLNVATNGPEWKQGITKDGRKIDWSLCIFMESGELIDSIKSWKHWKDLNAPTDYDNLKMEIVDIWHFLMSYIITTNHELANTNVIENSSFSKIINTVDRYNLKDIRTSILLNDKESVKIKEDIIKNTVELSFKLMHNDRTSNLYSINPNIILMYDFIDLLYCSGMDVDILYNMYIVKNTLNRFRQNNGYKDGSYIKIIDGKEDNENMMMFMNNSRKQLTADDLYALYEDFYNNKKEIKNVK